MRSLREIPADRPRRGATTSPSSSTATAASASPPSSTPPTRVSNGLAEARRRPRRPGRRPRPELPRVVPRLLGHRRHRRRPRRPQRLVEGRRDRLRPPGLRRQGPRRRPQAPRARRRRPRRVPRPRARPPRRLRPGRRRPRRRRPGPPLRRAHRRPDRRRCPTTPIDEDDPAVILYTSGTTGRPKGAVSTHRNMIANLQNTLFTSVYGVDGHRRRAAPDRRADRRRCSRRPLFHVSGLHSGLVVGLLAGLRLVMIEGRFEPDQGARAHPGRGASPSGPPSRRWCGGCASTRPATTTTPRRCARVAFGGSPSADELQRMVRETFPNVKGGSNAYGLTETSSVATVLLRRRRRVERPDLGRPAGADRARSRIVDDARQRACPSARPARCSSRADAHGRLLGQARGDRRRHPRRLAAHRRHRLRSTTRATSSSPTARRT